MTENTENKDLSECFILVGPRRCGKSSTGNTILAYHSKEPYFNVHDDENNNDEDDGNIRIKIASFNETKGLFVAECVGFGSSRRVGGAQKTSYKKFADEFASGALRGKQIKFLFCVRFDKWHRANANFDAAVSEFCEVFGERGVRSLVLIAIQTEHPLCLDEFTRTLHETSEYKKLRGMNENEKDVPFVLWDNYCNSHPNQIENLRKQAASVQNLQISSDDSNPECHELVDKIRNLNRTKKQSIENMNNTPIVNHQLPDVNSKPSQLKCSFLVEFDASHLRDLDFQLIVSFFENLGAKSVGVQFLNGGHSESDQNEKSKESEITRKQATTASEDKETHQPTENTVMNENKNVIVFAEKSETNGTRVAFKRLFGVEFEPNRQTYEKVTYKNRSVSVLYLNLCEFKYNEEYAKERKERLKNTNVEGVICFEYCNPRVQEIDQNIRELRALFELEKIEFMFYTEKNNEHEAKPDKEALVKQMLEYPECQYVDKLADKVFVL